jgi:hypothetical protein
VGVSPWKKSVIKSLSASCAGWVHAGTARVSKVLPGFTLRVFPALLSTENQYLCGFSHFSVDFLRVLAGFMGFMGFCITLVPSSSSFLRLYKDGSTQARTLRSSLRPFLR